MTVIDLEPASKKMAEVLAGVRDELMGAPTPCGDYTLGDLVDHVGTLTVAFTLAAKKETPPGLGGRPVPDAARLPEDWRSRIPEDMQELVEAWRDPAAWDGMTRAGGIEMPGGVCGIVVLDELVLHAWDIAHATGQSYEPDPASVEAIHGFVLQFSSPGLEDMREGLFGPPFPVPDDAPLWDRVLGLSGRDPSWSPRS